MRLFVDANVLFSASMAESRTDRLFRHVVGRCTLVTSTSAAYEALRNVMHKHPAAANRLAELLAITDIVDDQLFTLDVGLSEHDRVHLCSAMAVQCDMLVTGDRRHFGHLFGETIEGVRVITLRTLAEWIEQQM